MHRFSRGCLDMDNWEPTDEFVKEWIIVGEMAPKIQEIEKLDHRGKLPMIGNLFRFIFTYELSRRVVLIQCSIKENFGVLVANFPNLHGYAALR